MNVTLIHLHGKVRLDHMKAAKKQKVEVTVYLRKQLIHSLLQQRIEILHGVSADLDEGALRRPALQTHNSAPDVCRADAQMDAERDGRH